MADFKKELEVKGIENPDIGIDEKDNIHLSDVGRTKTIATGQKIEDYK